MGGETDFHKLYAELGLAPGCDMRALTQAYRRRIQELHPDRRQNVDPGADERLRTLIALYDAAGVFHRRYGRLPGAAYAATPAPRPVVPDHPMPDRAMPDRPRPEPRPRSHNWVAALALPVIGVLLWWYWDAAVPESIPAANPAPDADTAAPRAIAQELAIGMDPESVLAVQGQPPLDLGERWEYGPSFVRFEHRKVVDWYSSPLRPLRTSSQRPPPPATPPPTLH